ncbi:MAG: hypothetical protein Q9219_001350 [cf. Caloplaca sp. 3 TL-2023]
MIAYWQDSFISDYVEIVFYLPATGAQAVRVVPKSDPKAVDLDGWTSVIAKDVKGAWDARENEDQELLSVVNKVAGRNDTQPWWKEIIAHDRQMRARREAQLLLDKFGSISRFDQAAKERVVQLINQEAIDYVIFHSVTAEPDEHGIRPSLASLRAKQRQDIDQATLSAVLQRIQGVQEPRVTTPVAADAEIPTKVTEPARVAAVTHFGNGETVDASSEQHATLPSELCGESGQSSHTENQSTIPTDVAAAQSVGPAPPVAPYYTAYPSRWNHLRWAYRTYTTADLELQANGIWLYDRPTTFLSSGGGNEFLRTGMQLPVTVIPNASATVITTPSALVGTATATLHAHDSPWPNDSRLMELTRAPLPDALFDTRLVEYQALETAGYRTQDFSRHHQECGPDSNLITTIIDNASAPPRFSRLLPAIRKRNGRHNYYAYRQRHYAQLAGGHYTLFGPQTGEPISLHVDHRFHPSTGQEYPYRGFVAEMEARMERCLNIALFDRTQTMVVEYLARLIQLCLAIKGSWNKSLARILAEQLAQEFNVNVLDCWRNMAAQPLCECEWIGGEISGKRHTKECRSGYRVAGEVFRGSRRCLKGLVEAMEAKHWVLRAWRTQHSTEPEQQRRVLGHGFPGCVVPAGWVPKLGKGWIGFWADDDDVCV